MAPECLLTAADTDPLPPVPPNIEVAAAVIADLCLHMTPETEPVTAVNADPSPHADPDGETAVTAVKTDPSPHADPDGETAVTAVKAYPSPRGAPDTETPIATNADLPPGMPQVAVSATATDVGPPPLILPITGLCGIAEVGRHPRAPTAAGFPAIDIGIAPLAHPAMALVGPPLVPAAEELRPDADHPLLALLGVGLLAVAGGPAPRGHPATAIAGVRHVPATTVHAPGACHLTSGGACPRNVFSF